jgi:NADH-ubiquinone oxidoreductase chain 3
MTSTTFFFVFIPLLAIILLAVNLIFAPHNPYQEKDSAFECGFHSFLGQNRTQFSISFFIFALLFLLFDLEILLVYPYVVSAYTNGIYGLTIMLIFFLALTLGFAFELGKNALKIDSRQMLTLNNNNLNIVSVPSYVYNFVIFYFLILSKSFFLDKIKYIKIKFIV